MYLLDTNVLIYAATHQDERKHRRAAELIRWAYVTGEGILSPQVLRETANCLLRLPGNAPERVQKAIMGFRSLHVCQEPADLVEQAIALHSRYGIQFFDALIVAAAQSAGCNIVYSEDLSDGQKYGSVEVVNPFHNPT